MTRLVVTANAESDFEETLAYLQREAGARIAIEYGHRFDVTLRRLVQFPRSCSPRPALGASARVARVPPNLLIYDYNLEADAVILRILHERRNMTRKLIRNE
ncbi:MAG: type II toxin-antitoxin system RelE/ParE family toxin [Xanthobacteraceae bacterium]